MKRLLRKEPQQKVLLYLEIQNTKSVTKFQRKTLIFKRKTHLIFRIVSTGGEAAAGPQPAAATEATTEAPADGAEAPAPADGTAAPVEGEPVSAEETPASTEAAPSDPAAPSATTEVAGEEPSVSRSDLVPGTVPAPEEVTGLETVPEVCQHLSC